VDPVGQRCVRLHTSHHSTCSNPRAPRARGGFPQAPRGATDLDLIVAARSLEWKSATRAAMCVRVLRTTAELFHAFGMHGSRNRVPSA
jgi:hypothetical protein